MNDAIPHEVNSEQDVDDLLTTVRTQGLDVVERRDPLPHGAMQQRLEEAAEDIDLNPSPGAPEADNDPVRVYLREMGASPLLTREGEVDLAKRLERGQTRVLKALSRSPIVIRELLLLRKDLKKDVRSIMEVVPFDDEEITDEILQNRLNEFTEKVDNLAKLYKKAQVLEENFKEVSKTTVSLIERTPRFNSSPMARTWRTTIGERESAFKAESCPRSMRLAISTSPSRVSRGEAPISRR